MSRRRRPQLLARAPWLLIFASLALIAVSRRSSGFGFSALGVWVLNRLQDSRIAWWLAILSLAWLGLAEGSLGLVLLDVGLFGIYELFFCPTPCAVQTKGGTPCANNVKGRIRACWIIEHRRVKHDALWKWITRRQNPFAQLRMTWRRGNSPSGTGTPTGNVPQVPGTGGRDAINLILALVSTFATVIGTWLTWLQFIKHQ